MSERREHDFGGEQLRRIFVRNADVRGGGITECRLRGVDIWNVEIHGELRNVTINGVDVAPLIESELDRRDQDRAKMRPDTPDGFREAWAILEDRWTATVERARTFTEEQLHQEIDGEWSFIQTLRHLCFATDAWVARMVLGNPSPWHALDLPWDEAPGWEGIPWDRDARPDLAEVLAVRTERQAVVRDLLDGLTQSRLDSNVTMLEPGWPQMADFPLEECLHIVLGEEWEHRIYAERDLGRLT